MSSNPAIVCRSTIGVVGWQESHRLAALGRASAGTKLPAQEAITQRPADTAAGVPLVLPEMALPREAAPFRYAPSSLVGIGAQQGAPVRAQRLEQGMQHAVQRLGDVAPPLVAGIGEVPNLKRRQLPVGHA